MEANYILTFNNPESDYHFNIPHQINGLIRDKINAVFSNNRTHHQYDYLALLITTNKKCNTTKIELSNDIDHDNKTIEWIICIPNSLVQKDNQIIDYIEYIFNALLLISQDYNINKFDITKEKDIILKELNHNKKWKKFMEIPVCKVIDASKK